MMIVIATWPEMRIIERRLGGRRGLAVAVMTLIMLAVILVPVGIAVFTLDDDRHRHLARDADHREAARGPARSRRGGHDPDHARGHSGARGDRRVHPR